MYPEPEPEPVQPVVQPAAAVAVPALEIGFRNPLAVRIGLFLAILTFLLSVLLGPFIVIWMLLAGIVAVWLYAKRTGEALTITSGARLGWITGVFTFLIVLLLISFLALALTNKEVVDTILEQTKQRGMETSAREMIDALQKPDKIVQAIIVQFVSCALLPVLGGMLGARFFRPRA